VVILRYFAAVFLLRGISAEAALPVLRCLVLLSCEPVTAHMLVHIFSPLAQWEEQSRYGPKLVTDVARRVRGVAHRDGAARQLKTRASGLAMPSWSEVSTMSMS
jgi:hypothetical protein